MGRASGRGLHEQPVPPAVRSVPPRFRPERGGAARARRSADGPVARELRRAAVVERRRRVQGSARARRPMTGDPLLQFRSEFPILERTTYLVSNSLGAMPRSTPDRLAEYVDAWAELGVRAWAQGWWEMPVTVGDTIAPLIGAS